MSSAEANPESNILVAARMYGTSSEFTMKPARSCERITVLPRTSRRL
jgi:hypothetical protein